MRTPVKSPSTKPAEMGPPAQKKLRLNTSKPTANMQHEFDSDMCQMFASCGWAWNSANNPQLRQFFSKWIPGVQVPDRRKLSGAVLDAEVRKVEDRIKVKVEGQLATGQCDGWKNISKTSVIGTMITVDGEVRTPFSLYLKSDHLHFHRHISFTRTMSLPNGKRLIIY
jgi:hypothetical protein